MFLKRINCFIVADIGGTKTTIAIINKSREILFKKIYLSSEIKHFTDTLLQFMHLPECKKYPILEASIAVAGIINTERNYARPTNLEWTVDSNSILVRTPLKRVVLLNDFEAIGLGIDGLKPESYRELTNLGFNDKGTIAVIGAGTGLGMSIIPNISGKGIPIPSEGGHIDLPILVTDKIDVKLQSFLIQKKLYKDSEDVVSGRGIVNIYKFLLTQKIKHDKKIRLLIAKSTDEEKPAMITKYALEDRDLLCIRTLELFIKYYARIAKNLALMTTCSQMILAGGIAPKIASALEDVFVEEFVQHKLEIMRKMLERTPIIVITDFNISLYGALKALSV